MKKSAKNNSLLSPDEIAICSKISQMDVPEKTRALALIKLNGGESRRVVSEQTALTMGQIQYLLGRFREKRLDIFAKVLPDLRETDIVPADDAVKIEKSREQKEKSEKKAKKSGKKAAKSDKGKKKRKKEAKKKKSGKGSEKSKKGTKGKKSKKGKKNKKGKKAKKSSKK